jgi:opacity protein-like surface antigen
MLNPNLNSNKVSKLVKSIILVSSFGLLSGVSSLAWSQSNLPGDDSRIREKGVTLEIGGGYSIWDDSYFKDKGILLSLQLGYKFNKNIEVDLGQSFATSFVEGVEIASVTLKGILPFESGFLLYGKTGPGYASAGSMVNSDQGSFAWVFGLGLDYHFTEGFYVGLGGDVSLFKYKSALSNVKKLNSLWGARANIGYIF